MNFQECVEHLLAETWLILLNVKHSFLTPSQKLSIIFYKQAKISGKFDTLQKVKEKKKKMSLSDVMVNSLAEFILRQTYYVAHFQTSNILV